MMNAIIRRLLGLKQPEPLKDGPAIEANKNPPASHNEKLTYGKYFNVPLEASFDPKDLSACAQFMEQYSVVPANDGTSMLVFSGYFLSETANGDVQYDEWAMRGDRDVCDHRERLGQTIEIYEHLFRGRDPHPRVVRYLGPTTTGYRLERLSPGFVWPYIPDDDVTLALYQRWAMQILSALQWIHERGVTLQRGAIQEEAMWLRSDYSIAIAGFVTAGCLDLNIPADGWPTFHSTSPWGQQDCFSDDPCDWRATGTPRGDIFDWATWFYDLVTAEGSLPGQYDADAWNAGDRSKVIDWPVLPKEQLGPVLVKAWRGEYDSASEALEDARRLLEKCGRQLSLFKIDEIDGFDWPSLFEVGKKHRLQLRQISEKSKMEASPQDVNDLPPETSDDFLDEKSQALP